MKLLSHEPLSRHTTLRTGGAARWLIEAESENEVREGVRMAQKQRLPFVVLGGGSNLLAPDAGFEGVVIKMANRGIAIRESAPGETEVIAEAGEEWDSLVAFSVERGSYGLENLSLIPGRVGGAVIGNIGAYGAEVKDTLFWAEALDARTLALRRFSNVDCAFAYRNSFFKTREGRNFILVRAAFRLRTEGVVNTAYRDVSEWFATRAVANPSPANVREAVVEIRRRKMPDPLLVGTAGSFFKNPVISREDYEVLVARYPGLPGQEEKHHRVKIPLGWILDKVCHLRGVRQGPVGTHAGQALVIVNEGGTAAQVEALAHEMGRKVSELTGIQIEWEVEKL